MQDIDREAIEREAYDLQKRVWRNRDQLLPPEPRTALQLFGPDEERQTTYLLRLMRPEVACQFLGINFAYRESLGCFGQGRGLRFECAGAIDRNPSTGEATIAISKAFRREQQLFTASHELGHYTLHPGEVRHRDRPVSHPARSTERWARPVKEREADQFGACYVMPAALVRQEFEIRFGRRPLKLSDHVAWALDHEDYDALLSSSVDSLAFESAVARAANFNGNGRPSLNITFGVSVAAMAMRLAELEVLEYAA